jgi:hypothetical protein
MRLENNNILHAAVLDPNDPATLDDLRFATGCKIHPYVLPEIWMHDWLFSLFKLPRGIRHIEADDADRELEKPAQSYDFQAAQAAIAAKANRIMVPAIVGVVEGNDSRPPAERKTLPGVDRAAVMAEAARASATAPQRNSLPGEMYPRAPGERTTFHGNERSPAAERAPAPAYKPAPATDPRPGQGAERQPAAPVRNTAPGSERQPAFQPRVTAQGSERQPAMPARATMQGSERQPAVPARTTMQGAERQPAVPARTTMLGAERQPANSARNPTQGSERQPAFGDRITQDGERPAAVENMLEPFPTVAGGNSVRPPPMSMRSLTDLGGRTSLPNVAGFPSAGLPSTGFPSAGLPSTGFPSAGLPRVSRAQVCRAPVCQAQVCRAASSRSRPRLRGSGNPKRRRRQGSHPCARRPRRYADRNRVSRRRQLQRRFWCDRSSFPSSSKHCVRSQIANN